jgi:hypothetical protein
MGDIVRQTLVAAFPGNERCWMQKLVSLPGICPAPPTPTDPLDFSSAWYWKVLRFSFPAGRFFAVLRQPCDVVLSSEQYTKHSQALHWRNLARWSRLIVDPLSLVEHVVFYDDLVGAPEQVTRQLADRFGFDWHPAMLAATKTVYAGSANRQKQRDFKAGWRAEWSRLAVEHVTEQQLLAVQSTWARFGRLPDLPDHFVAAGLTTSPRSLSESGGRLTNEDRRRLDFWSTELSLRGEYAEHVRRRLSATGRQGEYPAWIRSYVETVRREMGAPRPRVLEVMSGPLSVLAWGHEHGVIDLVATDPLAEQLVELMNRLQIQTALHPWQVDPTRLLERFKPHSFHLVYCRGELHRIADVQRFFAGADGLLIPGGYLIFEGRACDDKSGPVRVSTSNGRLHVYDQATSRDADFGNLRLVPQLVRPAVAAPGKWFQAVFQRV